jgi:hypothetical protein
MFAQTPRAEAYKIVEHSIAHELNPIACEKKAHLVAFGDGCAGDEEAERRFGGIFGATRYVNQ